MRIISGRAKGQHLRTAANNRIRPTSDRVKEALFNIIADRVAEANVLDLYAGSGNLGLEALSRGAAFATFVDKAQSANKFLRLNVAALRFEESCEIIKAEVIPTLHKLARHAEKYDLIFADPPYNLPELALTLAEISHADLLTEDGVLIVEKHVRHELTLKRIPLECVRENKYGDTILQFYLRKD